MNDLLVLYDVLIYMSLRIDKFGFGKYVLGRKQIRNSSGPSSTLRNTMERKL